MLIVKLCIKVNYITMFSKRGYIDSVISIVEPHKHDPKRMILMVQMPRKHFHDASVYSTSIEIIEDLLETEIEECKVQIQHKKQELEKLEKKLTNLMY